MCEHMECEKIGGQLRRLWVRGKGSEVRTEVRTESRTESRTTPLNYVVL